MDFFQNRKQGLQITAVIVSAIALGGFMYETGLLFKPLLLILLSFCIIVPFQKESVIVRRLMLIITLLFLGWLLSDLGFALFPFALALLAAYLLDPFVSFLERKGIPRWLSALAVGLLITGAITLVAVFVFPLIFSQLDSVIKKISTLVSSVSDDLNEKSIYKFFKNLGFEGKEMKTLIRTEFMPRLEGVMSNIMSSLMSLMTDISGVATKMVNVILVPVLFFYFLKDFRKLKDLIKRILEKKNGKMLFDLKRIDKILKTYIGWQITAAIIIGTSCSIFFSLFGIPYAIVLGIICGFLNPIPYLGIFASMLISFVTVLIVNQDNPVEQILIIAAVIGAMHFINTYFLEPNIAGRRVGLHPVVLIASLFVFGGLFGFLGLLIAVPLTATLMMFFKDWQDKYISGDSEENKESA